MVRCLLAPKPSKESRPPSSARLLKGSERPESSNGLAATPLGKDSAKGSARTLLTYFEPFLSICSQAEEIQKHHYGMGKSWRSILEIDMQISTPSTLLCSKNSHHWEL